MQADADIAKLCNAIYDPIFNQTGWDHFWSDFNGICAGIKNNTLIFRGSVTLEDWYRDLLARGFTPKTHPQLDVVDFGFDEGMDEFFEEAAKFLGPSAAIGGHSLGAARAWLFAGRYIAEGGSPSRIAVFGSPRPGGQALGQILASHSKISFKNRFDPVTDVPFALSGVMPIQPTSFTMINVKPAFDDIGLFSDHHMPEYLQGVQ